MFARTTYDAQRALDPPRRTFLKTASLAAGAALLSRVTYAQDTVHANYTRAAREQSPPESRDLHFRPLLSALSA